MEDPQAYARGILKDTINDMGFKSGSAYGNELGLTFFDRMDALESEVRKLRAEINAKIDTKFEKINTQFKKIHTMIDTKFEKIDTQFKKIDTEFEKSKEEFLEETRKLREEIERNTDIVKDIRGEHKKISERIYYVYERDVPKASGSKVISNEKAAAQEDSAFMDAFHFSSETGGERQAEDNDQKEQIFSERPSGKRAGRT